MIWTRQRRPPGKVLYTIFWIGAILIGLGFLGNLPHLVPDFLRNYSRDKASAFEVLTGQMIVWAIGAFCILGIIDANKARRDQGTKATHEYDARSLGSVTKALSSSSTLPESASPAPLHSLKDELFSLESDRLTGKVTQEEYVIKRAVLETRLKLASGVAEAEISQPMPIQPKEEQTPEEPNKVSPWIAVPIVAVLGWTGLLAYARGGYPSEATGYWIGMLLIPFLIAYAIAGAKRRRNWMAFSWWFFGLGIILSGSMNQKSLTSLSPPDMLKELSGTKPLEENLPENQKEMAAVTRAVFAELRANEKSTDEQIEAIRPEMERLYTSESFSSIDAIRQTKGAIDKALSLDSETAALLERLPDSLKARLNQTSLSDSEKNQFMEGFLTSFNKTDYVSARRQVMTTETDWANSVNDLYSFSLQHFSDIAVRKGSIIIAREGTRSSFNQKLSRAQNLQEAFLAARKRVEELRDASFKKSGISLADMGLKN